MDASLLIRIYGDQPFFTPGAAETVDLISEQCGLSEASLLLDVAYGRGEASFRLAERHGCRTLGVDPHRSAAAVAAAAGARGLSRRAAFAVGDGGRLPVRDAAFDAAICIGAPSIVGTERCVSAMHRALRPGGMVAVSDWVWANPPLPPKAIPAGIDATPAAEDYAKTMQAIGFEVVYAAALPQHVWDDYYTPLRANLARMRADDPTIPHMPIDDELRIYDAFGEKHWRYAVFIARKTG